MLAKKRSVDCDSMHTEYLRLGAVFTRALCVQMWLSPDLLIELKCKNNFSEMKSNVGMADYEKG